MEKETNGQDSEAFCNRRRPPLSHKRPMCIDLRAVVLVHMRDYSGQHRLQKCSLKLFSKRCFNRMVSRWATKRCRVFTDGGLRDASGTTEIVASPATDERGGAFNLKFTPSAPIRLDDSVIVALIAKSLAVEIEDGDVIVLTISTRSLSEGQHTGTRSESLKFNLRGLWQETGVHIEWK